MSVIFTNTPEQFQPVLSDGIFFTASADTTNTYNFRYIYDLYVNNQFVFQGKATPNPFGLGIIDLQQILETYCFNNVIASWNGTPIYTHTTFPFSKPYYDETITYQIKCGYEYSSTPLGAITGFTGNGNAIGTPNYPSQQYKTFRSTMGVNGRATQQDFNIDPFVLSGDPTTINPTTSGLFLTNSPRNRNIQPSEYYTLGFTNYFMGGALLSEPYYVKYTFYDNQGQEITGTTYENITTNGGGPRTSCNQVYQSIYQVSPTSASTYNTLYVGAGPKNIPNFPSNAVQYTIQLFGVFTGTTSPIQPTPTPTPSPTSTPSTPTPTPTPSATPGCTACNEYAITNTGTSTATIFIINCSNGSSQSFTALTGQTYVACSCSTPTSESGTIDYQLLGACSVPQPSPTPTPSNTPSPAVPCICLEYECVAAVDSFGFVDYTDCNGSPAQLYMYPNTTEYICACQGSPVGFNVSVVESGPYCGCNCSTYNVENTYGSTLYFDYLDCNGDPQTLSIDAGDDFNICACYGTIIPQTEPLNITYIGTC